MSYSTYFKVAARKLRFAAAAAVVTMAANSTLSTAYSQVVFSADFTGLDGTDGAPGFIVDLDADGDGIDATPAKFGVADDPIGNAGSNGHGGDSPSVGEVFAVTNTAFLGFDMQDPRQPVLGPRQVVTVSTGVLPTTPGLPGLVSFDAGSNRPTTFLEEDDDFSYEIFVDGTSITGVVDFIDADDTFNGVFNAVDFQAPPVISRDAGFETFTTGSNVEVVLTFDIGIESNNESVFFDNFLIATGSAIPSTVKFDFNDGSTNPAASVPGVSTNLSAVLTPAVGSRVDVLNNPRTDGNALLVGGDSTDTLAGLPADDPDFDPFRGVALDATGDFHSILVTVNGLAAGETLTINSFDIVSGARQSQNPETAPWSAVVFSDVGGFGAGLELGGILFPGGDVLDEISADVSAAGFSGLANGATVEFRIYLQDRSNGTARNHIVDNICISATVDGSTGSPQGDFNGDGVVNCDDIDEYIGLIGTSAAGNEAFDLTNDGTIDAADVLLLVTNHVVTSNGVTGTALADLNCDGQVNVLGDAFVLVSQLNNSVSSYSSGDINLDGIVNVFGDAFPLISNLGFSNN